MKHIAIPFRSVRVLALFCCVYVSAAAGVLFASNGFDNDSFDNDSFANESFDNDSFANESFANSCELQIDTVDATPGHPPLIEWLQMIIVDDSTGQTVFDAGVAPGGFLVGRFDCGARLSINPGWLISQDRKMCMYPEQEQYDITLDTMKTEVPIYYHWQECD